VADLSRREALRLFGTAAALAPFGLAACTNRGTPEPALSPLPPKAGQLSIATWPRYIDLDEETGRRPSVDAFTKETGISVDYQEVITDSEAFARTVREAFAEGGPAQYDLAVISNRMVGRLAREGYLEPLHHDLLPNFAAHAGAAFREPTYDPKNRYAVAWQGGMTGLAYDPNLTKRPITSIADLFDDAFAGRVGLSAEMLDTMTLILLLQKVKPETATIADARAAKTFLAAERRKIRAFYGSDAIDALARGEVAITMAWSSDVFQVQADNPELVFVVPDEGGVLWSDDMVILRGAQHPTDAHAWMNHYYQPVPAARVAERVTYVSPVPDSRAVLLGEAVSIKDPDERAEAERIANSSLIYPTIDTLARLRRYPVLSEDEQRAWNDLFQEAMAS
jgi:spermidine/putrescine transport system substrate-binding protein